MELRTRPAPIRYEETASPQRSFDSTTSRAAALAMQALHERISVLESENAQLHEALSRSKIPPSADPRSHEDSDTVRTRIRLLQETLQKTQETMRGQASVITRSKEELLAWQSKAKQLEADLHTAEAARAREVDTAQSQVKAAQSKLEAAVQRVAWLEGEVRTARTAAAQLETVAARKGNRQGGMKGAEDWEEKAKRLERDLEESKSRENSLKYQFSACETAVKHSEEARKLLLQLQIKSKLMMEEIVQVNERLVQTIHRQRNKKTQKDNIPGKMKTPSFQEMM